MGGRGHFKDAQTRARFAMPFYVRGARNRVGFPAGIGSSEPPKGGNHAGREGRTPPLRCRLRQFIRTFISENLRLEARELLLLLSGPVRTPWGTLSTTRRDLPKCSALQQLLPKRRLPRLLFRQLGLARLGSFSRDPYLEGIQKTELTAIQLLLKLGSRTKSA